MKRIDVNWIKMSKRLSGYQRKVSSTIPVNERLFLRFTVTLLFKSVDKTTVFRVLDFLIL